jgi:dihydrofolate reductase
MNVVLVAVSSLDGFIARRDGGMDWASKEDREWFTSYAQAVGVVIVGRKTYEAALKRGLLPLKLRMVMTHNPEKFEPQPNTIFTNDPPREVLAAIEKRGFSRVLVAGGGEVNSAFAKENLIDEIRLTIEPVHLGNGIPLFSKNDFERQLKLLETKNLNENTVQFHYQVIK